MNTSPIPQPKPARADLTGDAQALANVLEQVLPMTPPNSATPARSRAVVLWVYRDCAGHWCVREEGGKFAAVHSSRGKAASCARAAGHAAGRYHLFLQRNDGTMAEEHFDPDAALPSASHAIRVPFHH